MIGFVCGKECPDCGIPWDWITWEEPIEDQQYLQLTCPKCGNKQTYSIPREEFREIIFARFGGKKQ